MNLKLIKLAGFKSFVDATVIPFGNQINAIVGPNGCGKSNIVDAIRWVIGESSAKQLRGESLADVIFQGTTTRKAVGKAAIDLIFDNTDGRMGGEYAKYSEISVRRELTNDGQSNYYLNNTRCRRRDIIDLFLGTGLGARSYAIIEQGMISRLIEAKPEELRAHIEEAAGISKYKERRRETESRMRQTQENLERLNDVIQELDKQQRHLQRQANAAEKYKELKQQERLLQSQTKALQWQGLQQQVLVADQTINQQAILHTEQQTYLQSLATELEKSRVVQDEMLDQQQAVQKQFYEFGAEIARIEQKITSYQQQHSQWQQDLVNVEQLWQELQNSVENDQEQSIEIETEIAQLKPQMEQAKLIAEQGQQNLIDVEMEMQARQTLWDHFQTRLSAVTQEVEIARTNLNHHHDRLKRLDQRIQDLQHSLNQLDIQELEGTLEPLTQTRILLKEQLEQLQQALAESGAQISNQREHNQFLQQQIQQTRSEFQIMQGQYAALHALQQSALGQNDEKIKEWLTEHDLQTQPRLGQRLQVTPGWEQAVETVLSGYIDAISVPQVATLLPHLTALTQGKLTLLEQSKLSQPASEKVDEQKRLDYWVKADFSIKQWLANIYVAEDIDSARQLLSKLDDTDSVVTRDGIWLGMNWVRVVKPSDQEGGILLREQALQNLLKKIEEAQQQLQSQQDDLQQNIDRLHKIETMRDEQHRLYQQLTAQLTEVQTQISGGQSSLNALQQQQQRLNKEIAQAVEQRQELINLSEQTEQKLAELLAQQLADNEQKTSLIDQRDEIREKLIIARSQTLDQQKIADELAIRLATNENQFALLTEALVRNEKQLHQLMIRRDQLSAYLADQDNPLDELREQLQSLLQLRLTKEQELQAVEQSLDAHNQQQKQLISQHQQLTKYLDEIKNKLQNLQMDKQSLLVRQLTIKEQLADQNLSLENLVNELPTEINITYCEQQIEQLTARISRLGPINLAAIDEYQAVSERKNYLDKQQADLVEALTVLTEAIRKIDRETRAKFRDTYEHINQSFQQLFPRVFNGGKANLELTDDDLLETGVVVKAQPPGKRNNTIHMLSGGEKALTAIALVFALFALNPAPFCVLDEVDAPLDDLNVGRYCNLIKEMAKQTQFIVVSHNKITISTADNLLGITMQEPGVSRMVSVNMEQAVAMAEN